MTINDGTTHCIRDGDVFRWSFKNDEEYRRKSPSTAYWCMDNQCVYRDGEGLVDTYWRGVDADYFSSGSVYLNEGGVDLEFVCNLHDVEFIKYDIEDCDKVYNLSHQRGSYKLFAIDKGVGKSNAAILKKLQKKLEEAEYQKKSAEWDIERLHEEIKELENVNP